MVPSITSSTPGSEVNILLAALAPRVDLSLAIAGIYRTNAVIGSYWQTSLLSSLVTSSNGTTVGEGNHFKEMNMPAMSINRVERDRCR
jgi:hypothetical protein